MTTGNFLDHNVWFEQLPGVVVSAAALITDLADRVLLVKPNYRDHWTLPGGICEHGEPPHVGCAREIAEEIGLELRVGALLAIDWAQPYGPDARPIMHFLFDGGELDDGAGIVLQREELDDFRFADPAELSGFLAPYGVRRVAAALAGRAAGAAVYQPTVVT
jgi:ADP-ribose pyrophosphatase YjhB (NUDIX family)